MGDFGGSGFNGASAVTRKRRSAASRRPRPDSQFLFDGRDVSPPLSTPSSDNSSRQSPDGSSGHDSSVRRKEVNLNSLIPKTSSISRNEGLAASKGVKKYDKSRGEHDDFFHSRVSRPGSSASNTHKRSLSDLKQGSEDVPAQGNGKSNSRRREGSSPDIHIGSGRNHADAQMMGHSDGAPNGSAENKPTRVKLKLGGVTRTIHTKSNIESGVENGSASKLSSPSDAPRHRQKHISQDNSLGHHSLQDKVDALKGAPWQDVNEGGFQSKSIDKSLPWKRTDKLQSMIASEPVRKSRRVPKRRVLDGASDEDDEDDEIRYLEKLRASKVSSDYGALYETGGSEGTKKQKGSRVHKRAPYEEDVDFSLMQGTKEGRKKSKLEKDSDDLDYIEDEEGDSDEDKQKTQRKESLDSLADGRKEMSLTTRQRALQSAKDGSGGSNMSLIEFPNGLPPAPPRRQKEKLSEVEQQLKKSEAAQRRRMQVEKAARESEAEAIRKILGQDSNRKRREEKLQKKREELAQEKAAKFKELAASSVRWIMGPTGTTVTFPEAVGLPSIFNSKPCSYPPPREKCAGPSCTNTYKYRDSKSNLPLCSLQCYRAVQQSIQTVETC